MKTGSTSSTGWDVLGIEEAEGKKSREKRLLRHVVDEYYVPICYCSFICFKASHAKPFVQRRSPQEELSGPGELVQNSSIFISGLDWLHFPQSPRAFHCRSNEALVFQAETHRRRRAAQMK